MTEQMQTRVSGSVMIDEQIYAVRDVRLAREAFVVTAVAEGPAEFKGNYDYSLHDDTGGLVMSGRTTLPHVKARRGDSIEFSFSCYVTGKVGKEL